ncbi:putative Ig domain-containing protein [Ulvibacterium sp.]|uniref:putative Ig domain-containing protein n=1 Tax=Ulvibacterium sp. TaxID=2665914 RepID=UPI002611A74F|nr:putative Ig domain-containing protein [Ulvibacterium sp.]
MKYCVPLILLLLFSCAGKNDPENSSPNYLGQKNPDTIPQIFGEGVVSVKGRFDMGFAISPDGRSMAFGTAHESNPEETCIYLMNYVDGKWSSPDRSFLPDNSNTFFPMFSPTGDKFYFAKSTDSSETDLWVAQYKNHKLIDPRPMDSIVNSRSREAGHGISKSGTLYFTSNRDDQNECCGDIYRSELEPEGYVKIQKVDVLNSNSDEESLFLSPNEDYILIQAWKNEFGSKHDLYISYRTKDGLWTTPERMDSTINSKEIEQRPFVLPDNRFLFFSRMHITQENGQEIYDSDIYWVSTKSVFTPYPYNTEIETRVSYDEAFEVNFPPDLFKDIDDQALSYQVAMADGSELPKWIEFDPHDLSLKGVWKSKIPLTIKVTATDSSGNSGEFKIKLGEKVD